MEEYPEIRKCYVRLNRIPNNEKGKNSDKVRKTGKEYSDDSQRSGSEISYSDYSEEDSSSDEEITQDKLDEKEAKKLVCVDCDKSFISHASYLIHKRSHQSIQFRCVLCKKGSKNRQSLVCHMKRYHPEVKPFVCDNQHCEQSFRTQSLLKLHSRMHSKFMCKFCKQLFVRKRNMCKHVLEIH